LFRMTKEEGRMAKKGELLQITIFGDATGKLL
jgi:hypothetical protein